jgi:hypothetical protein
MDEPKPILILWGDAENPDVCRVGDDGVVLQWAEAEAQFGDEFTLICVQFVDDV